MQISSIQNIRYFTPTEKKQYPAKTISAEVQYINEPAFRRFPFLTTHSQQYLKAKEYLKLEKRLRGGFKNTEIYDLDLNLLDGIQDGIRIFKGLNMKEIAFVGQTITEIAVLRGCHNNCSHCYAGGLPPIREDANHINKMSWNDFDGLVSGFKELNKRLGFPVTRNKNKLDPYITAFHDADGIDICLKDNKGRIHDFIDIAEWLSEAFCSKNVFDTAGWSPKNKKAQLRAEKYAEYYSKHENKDKLAQFNLSVNPYHAMHTKEVQLRNSGEYDRAQKFRDLYIERMANVLYTFTPLISSGKLTFLTRAAANYSKVGNGFKERDLCYMYGEIFKALEQKYIEDYNGSGRFIKSKAQIKDLLASCGLSLSYINTSLCITERLAKLFSTKDTEVATCKQIRKRDIKRIKNAKNVNDVILNSRGYSKYAGLLDSNGRYYLTDYCITFPTEIQLNFDNKDKLTAPIEPYLQKDIVISRNIINSCSK